MMRRNGLAFVCLFLIFGCAAWSVRADEVADKIADRVDKVFEPFNRTDTPGCAVGVIRNGRLIYERGYGMASLELGAPNSPQMVYYIGSTSKQFVAASIVLASLQGHLSLDDNMRKYLPEIPGYGTPVTIRHMIHHTSGLRDYLTLMTLAGMPFENIYTDEELVALVARQKELNFEPGAEWLYSNSGYFLLAQIIGRATGKSLREYAEENIFQPLGMKHTHFHDTRTHVFRNRAMAYSPKEGGGFNLEWYINFDKVGSGGLLTTVEDLLLWDRNFYDDKLGGGKLVEQLLRVGALNDGKKLDYAFGPRIAPYRGLETVSHGGSFMGFRAQLLRFPKQKFSVDVLCNVSNGNPSRRARQVSEVYLGEKMEPDRENTRQARQGNRTGADEVSLSSGQLKEFAGDYYSEELQAAFRLWVEEGKLRGKVGSRPAVTLTPTGDNRFRYQFVQFEFERDSNNRVTGFTIQAGRVRNIRFTRFERRK